MPIRAFAALHQIQAKIERSPMREVNAAINRLRSGKARYHLTLEA